MDIIQRKTPCLQASKHIKKQVRLIALATALAVGTTFAGVSPVLAEPVAAAQEAEWRQVETGLAPLNIEGTMYLPMEAAILAMGGEIVWAPQDQTDKVKIRTPEAGYELYLNVDSTGSKTVSLTPEGPWTALVEQDDLTYLPMAFLQTLTNRTLSVTGSSLGLIDYAPAYDAAGVNTNPLWSANLAPYTYEAPVLAGAGIVDTAMQYLGVPYVWGGSSPSGFDCSGLTSYCYAQKGVGLPRTAAGQQAAAIPVSAAEAQPGDLVFWGAPAYHVGIYLAEGQYIHAPSPGQSVTVGSTAWYPYHSIGRVA